MPRAREKKGHESKKEAVLNLFATTEANKQLKDNTIEKKTVRDRDPRTRGDGRDV